MEIHHIESSGCIAIVYSNGQVNVYDKLVKISDLSNYNVLEKKLSSIFKKQNYTPKKVKAVKAVIFIEE